MNVEVTLEPTRGAFRVRDGAEQLGEMTFSRLSEHEIIVDHTAVSESARGRGVGRALFDRMVAWAREHQVQVLPLCPFTARMFDAVPEARDVLRPD